MDNISTFSCDYSSTLILSELHRHMPINEFEFFYIHYLGTYTPGCAAFVQVSPSVVVGYNLSYIQQARME